MTRRAVPTLLLLALITPLLTVPANALGGSGEPDAAKAGGAYRPDAIITLCGLSTGCTINPPPNPVKGKNVYNTTGARQTIAVRMEDGEGVRFWITFQNDGTNPDRLRLKGCNGTPRFEIRSVLIGKHKRPTWRAKNIEAAFKDDTWVSKELAPGGRTTITLNIVAPTTAEGVTYTCRVTIRSQNDGTLRDTVLARMTTF